MKIIYIKWHFRVKLEIFVIFSWLIFWACTQFLYNFRTLIMGTYRNRGADVFWLKLTSKWVLATMCQGLSTVILPERSVSPAGIITKLSNLVSEPYSTNITQNLFWLLCYDSRWRDWSFWEDYSGQTLLRSEPS